ncbi:ribonuclease H-like domain-containing protein, partial [Tanacetum coccineum]
NVNDSDEEELSDDDSLEEGMKNLESENDCSNSFEVSDTVFENEGGSKKDSSVDPFGLYPLLNKKTKDQKHKESGTNSSPKFPPGFTPNNDNDDTGDKKSVNDFEEEKLNEDDGDSNNSNLKENVDESASFGRFKKSVAPSLAQKAKKDWAKELCVKNKVNFLAIQETKMEEIDLFSVRRGVWLLNGIDLMIIAVYAPHDPRDKRMLWDYLAHVINQWQGEVVIMGDFNEVRVKSDRFGTNFNVLGANIFNSFINSTGLEEVHLGGSAFTWCHKSATKMSKLDRFFVSNNLLNIFPHISGITLDRFLSDHRPILLRESAHDYGPVPFRFFHHWIHLEGFNDFVTSTWNSAPSVDSNGMRNLAGKLKFLKAHIKIWIKDNKSETVSTIANLKKELNQLDAVIDKGTGTEVEAEKRMEVLAALRNIDHIHSMDLAQKAKIKWSIEGDENSNFFHGILNKKRNQMNIRGITIDGVWKEQPNDVKQEFLSHFQDRFAKPSERRANIDMRFPKTISEDQSQDLEREVSKQEIKTAVWGCGTDKSPGPDGFSFGFYRHFWPVIEHDVYMAVNHFFIHGEIPPGCNSSFIALIPKVPDANLVKDFRPISLIGSIYKIIAKIFSNRLVWIAFGDIIANKVLSLVEFVHALVNHMRMEVLVVSMSYGFQTHKDVRRRSGTPFGGNPAQTVCPAQSITYQLVSPTQQAHSGSTVAPLGSMGPTVTLGQETTTLPHAFTAGTLHDPAPAAWNMDTGASSHLNNSITSLSEIFNTCMYPSISVGDGHSIPVTNTGHSILPTPFKSLHLNNVLITPHIVKNLISVRQFVRDNNCTIEFDAFGFSVKDFLTRRVLLRCDSTGDLYPVTAPSPIPHAFHVSQHMWHQRLGHPRGKVMRRLASSNFILYNKEKSLVLCHACQLGKHVRLPFVSSSTVISSCFDIIHSDVYVRTQFKCEIKAFQCDHGGEFDNCRLHTLFAKNGIQFRFSCPQTSQQNGKFERMLEGVDVDETFSPVVKPGTIRIVLSLATSRHWPIHQLDVKNSFLHGNLIETVYMHQPPGFQDSQYPDYVCLLQRSLYGLKQAPRAWFQRFASYITRVGFQHSRCDSSLFIYQQGTDTAYLLLYVDDIVLTASSETLLRQIIAFLHKEFSMTDLGSLNYFLGIFVSRDSTEMFLSQKKYIVEILERAHMVNCNPSRTPIDTESKLGSDGDVVSDPTLYRSLAGSLQYLTFTRPDISYAGTLDYGLQLFSSSTTDLVAYSDADWAGCPTTRLSTSGYCVFLGNNLLSWSSKRQPTLSHSSAEVEYRGVANAVAETCWLRNLLRELYTPLSSDTLVYCDNVSAVYLSCNPVQHQRTKHIEIDIHFIRDLVAAGHVRVLHVPSRYQFADIFTKGFPSALFEEFRSRGSMLQLMEDLVKVGQIMGYNMDGCLAQNAKKDWVKELRNINKNGDVVIMGEFNKVRNQEERYGSIFNMQGANAFNSFISDAGLEEVHLGGCSFSWCHKSANKMSKLGGFLISESLMSLCPNIHATTLDHYLSDHRPILMRESQFDYGLIPFRFYHYWFEIEGFDTFVERTWKDAQVIDSNDISKFMKKLRYLKEKIRAWIKSKKDNSSNHKKILKAELAEIDLLIYRG